MPTTPIMRLRSLALLALAALLLIAAAPASARWGDAGHRIIGEAAARALPAEMPAFFRDASGDLTYLNPEPDRWRDNQELGLDRAVNSQALDHYVDME